MARKKIEPNISYDDQRSCYYVYMDYGTDERGTRIRRYKTFSSLQQARKALRDFHAERALNENVTPQKLTLEADDDRFDEIVEEAAKACRKGEPDCTLVR